MLALYSLIHLTPREIREFQAPGAPVILVPTVIITGSFEFPNSKRLHFLQIPISAELTMFDDIRTYRARNQLHTSVAHKSGRVFENIFLKIHSI